MSDLNNTTASNKDKFHPSNFYSDNERYTIDVFEEEQNEWRLAMEHGLLDCGQDDYYEYQERLAAIEALSESH